MAKVKSKKITIEDALVPVEEQPYEVPKNWCWIHWGDAGEFIAGSGFKNQYQGYNDYDIPFYKVGSLKYSDFNGYLYDNSNTINEDMRAELKATLIPVNSVLFAKIGEAIRLNRRSLNSIPCCIDNNMMAFLAQKCDYKYAFYWSRGLDLYNYTNATTVPAIRKSDLEKIPFPLPPLLEQQRIVEQIESLFSKLDEAKEKAQNVIDSYDMRVKSILDKAFRGEYSKKWRDNNKVSLEDWTDSHINEVCIPRAGFAFDSKKFTSEGYQVIRMGNLYAGELDLTRSPVFIAKEDVDNNVLSRSLVHDGDILITLTGTKYKRDYGYAVCIEGNPELLVNQRILCLTPTEKIDKDYLLFYLRSEGFRDIFFSCETGGVNQGNVSSKFVENIELKLPSIEEQRVIASLLKDIMDKEDQAKEISIGIVDEIDIMKKSILAKAFKGELGTNDSSDEPAEELLERILTEAPVEEKKNSTTRKKKVKVVMNKDLLETVREVGKITPERLKEETGLGIDEFYEELKRLTESGQVSEKKEGGDVYLEVGDADR